MYQTRRAAYECVEVVRKQLEHAEVDSEKAKKIIYTKEVFLCCSLMDIAKTQGMMIGQAHEINNRTVIMLHVCGDSVTYGEYGRTI